MAEEGLGSETDPQDQDNEWEHGPPTEVQSCSIGNMPARSDERSGRGRTGTNIAHVNKSGRVSSKVGKKVSGRQNFVRIDRKVRNGICKPPPLSPNYHG